MERPQAQATSLGSISTDDSKPLKLAPSLDEFYVGEPMSDAATQTVTPVTGSCDAATQTDSYVDGVCMDPVTLHAQVGILEDRISLLCRPPGSVDREMQMDTDAHSRAVT